MNKSANNSQYSSSRTNAKQCIRKCMEIRRLALKRRVRESRATKKTTADLPILCEERAKPNCDHDVAQSWRERTDEVGSKRSAPDSPVHLARARKWGRVGEKTRTNESLPECLRSRGNASTTWHCRGASEPTKGESLKKICARHAARQTAHLARAK